MSYNDPNLILIDNKTRQEVKVGNIRQTFRGENVRVMGFNTRRVWVRFIDTNSDREFFPSVIGCTVTEKEEEGPITK